MKRQNFEADDIITNKSIEDIVLELKNACNCKRAAMFVSVALRDDEGNTKYINECLLAALEEPKHITRINKLLLAVNEASIEVPDNINRCINELSSYIEQYKSALTKIKQIETTTSTDKYFDYLMVSEGLSKVSIPSELYGNSIEDIDIDDLDDTDGISDYN